MPLSARAKLAAVAFTLGAGGGAVALKANPKPQPAPVVGQAPTYAWVQLEPGRAASVRAVMPSAAAGCPTLTVDGAATPMSKRGQSPADFVAVFVCEHTLSAPAKSLAIGALTLPAPTFNASSALVLGDTGCRESGSSQQSCTGDPTTGAWGFPALSKAAASARPDFVLHVGDYLYRESGCADPTVCGDVWGAWEADFFKPAEAGGLLRLAPWVPIRGNHEDCHRGWDGYSLFFAPGPMSASSCPTSIPPYGVTLSGLTLYVTDSSAKSAQQAQADFTKVKALIGSNTTPAWLATHVPVCSDGACGGSMGAAYNAAGLGAVAALRWLHVGHVHLFDHTVAGANHPAQTVSGGSGTALDCSSMCIDSDKTDCVASCDTTKCGSSDTSHCPTHAYTYMTVTAQSSGWDATVYDQSGAKTGITLSVSGAAAPGGQ